MLVNPGVYITECDITSHKVIYIQQISNLEFIINNTEAILWIMDNIKYTYKGEYINYYRFCNEEDAMYFKLVWMNQ